MLDAVLLGLVASAHGFAPCAARTSAVVARPRMSAPPAMDLLGTANLLAAQVFGLDTNPYGGVSSFSQTDTGASGDLNTIILLTVLFPTAVTVFIYKDQIFAPPVEVEPPKGWKKVPSQSRPGKFSYLNTKTGQRYDKLPRDAFD